MDNIKNDAYYIEKLKTDLAFIGLHIPDFLKKLNGQ